MASEQLEILKKLADYTEFHFRYEQDLFDKFDYPETAEHVKIHENLVSQVLEFKSQFENGKASLTMDLMEFLTKWLKNHILETDKAYVPFLQEKMDSKA